MKTHLLDKLVCWLVQIFCPALHCVQNDYTVELKPHRKS
jgi:hypothetical protein